MLRIKELSKSFSTEDEKKLVLSSVSFSIEEGKISSIIGSSGSGKSTLLNILTGMLSPSQGFIIGYGKTLKKRDFTSLRGKEIGYVWQGQSLLNQFSVLENVCLPYYLSGGKDNIHKKGLQLLEQIGLEEKASLLPSEISIGEAKRVAIARALLLEPSFLVADEPTNHLDEENRRKIIQLFLQLKKEGMTILCSTHDKDLIEASDVVYELKDKTIHCINYK